MKKRIFRSVFYTAFAAVVIFGITAAFAGHHFYKELQLRKFLPVLLCAAGLIMLAVWIIASVLSHRAVSSIEEIEANIDTEKLKAEEIRKDFSANVSHELKTPLTTIKGFGEMLEKGIITDVDSVKKYGGTIYRESERLLLLINDIIRLSEIEEASADELLQPLDLLKAAEDAAEILQLKADSHEVTLSVGGENLSITANPSYISELFLNLIDNAVKYNNPGGHVWVTVSKKDANAVISVKDDGIGIPDEHKERIFERFYRVDKSRSKQTGGTGLGLSIVKHIASYHCGNVSLESKTGVGTEITVILPLYRS